MHCHPNKCSLSHLIFIQKIKPFLISAKSAEKQSRNNVIINCSLKVRNFFFDKFCCWSSKNRTIKKFMSVEDCIYLNMYFLETIFFFQRIIRCNKLLSSMSHQKIFFWSDSFYSSTSFSFRSNIINNFVSICNKKLFSITIIFWIKTWK